MDELRTPMRTFSESSNHELQFFLWVFCPDSTKSWSKKLIFILSISEMMSCRWRMIFWTNFYLFSNRTPKEKVVARDASYPKMWSSRSVAQSHAPLEIYWKPKIIRFFTKIGLHRNTFSSNLFNSFTKQNLMAGAFKWGVDRGIC